MEIYWVIIIYNRNEFEDYLLNNTKLDEASSSRHGF